MIGPKLISLRIWIKWPIQPLEDEIHTKINILILGTFVVIIIMKSCRWSQRKLEKRVDNLMTEVGDLVELTWLLETLIPSSLKLIRPTKYITSLIKENLEYLWKKRRRGRVPTPASHKTESGKRIEKVSAQSEGRQEGMVPSGVGLENTMEEQEPKWVLASPTRLHDDYYYIFVIK